MVYVIKWRTGGKTVEKYATKALAKRVLLKSGLSGNIVETKLGSAGRTVPSVEVKYGKGKTAYPNGRKLKWIKTADGIYRKTIVR